ncbi:hypothetical protein NKH73_22215 [Mesorhizobium sp. M0938]|uniref:hypothetical protein n=1 Tax=unclassified Mesorhizobium TaxID=325217 RepID=UPI00333B0381
MQIIMTPKEVDLLSSFLSKTKHYFEFGMGGTTLLASSLVAQSVTSIESDKEWVEKVRSEIGDPKIKITLRHIYVGPTGGWGTPVDRSHEHLFPTYSNAIVEADTEKIDFCLVDGRFRVACFMTALLWLRQDAIIAIHDYTVRPHYHLVEEFARNVATCNTLALFVRRSDADTERMQAVIENYVRNHE